MRGDTNCKNKFWSLCHAFWIKFLAIEINIIPLENLGVSACIFRADLSRMSSVWSRWVVNGKEATPDELQRTTNIEIKSYEALASFNQPMQGTLTDRRKFK
jgi:hypothetical protein